MSLSDPISDMITRIRNAQRNRKGSCLSPCSNLLKGVLDVLAREGYIRGYDEQTVRPGVSQIKINLKYSDGQPAIQEIKKISLLSRRVYAKVADLPRIRAGLGIAIVSTPKGLLSDAEAREANVGGEVLCQVF